MQQAADFPCSAVPEAEDRDLVPQLQAVISRAAATLVGARLVIVDGDNRMHMALSEGSAHASYLSLALNVVTRGEMVHESRSLAAPVYHAHRLYGILIVYWTPLTANLQYCIDLAHEYVAHLEHILAWSAQRVRMLRETAAGLVKILAVHDPETARHSQLVARYSRALGVALGLPPHELLDLELGGLLHDIGKVGVAQDILSKTGSLTTSEWVSMRQHSAHGDRTVSDLLAIAHIAPTIRHHHERWDGDGYPDRLVGEAIPYQARVVALADAYEAMRTGRPYQYPRTPEQVLRDLRLAVPSQFDAGLLPFLPALIAVDSGR
jgi:HD-GYP domain-containing protein (c-di-GMP phosphodiesterase class II)